MLKFGRYFALVAILAVAVAGCGKSEAEKEAESGKSGEGTVTCSGNALSGETGLPAGFPELDGVTFVKARDSGPTRVVDGYSDESIEGLYNEYKERFAEAQYTGPLLRARGGSRRLRGLVQVEGRLDDRHRRPSRLLRQRERLRARDGATGGLS